MCIEYLGDKGNGEAAIDYLRKQQRFSQLVVNEEQLPDIPDEAGIAETCLLYTS